MRPSLGSFRRFAERVEFALEPHQKKVAAAAFGDQPELLVLLPRGNGKSRLIGALAVHHLLSVPSAAVYLCAASRDQAAIVFAYARDFGTHPAISDKVTVRHLELRVAGGFLRVIASDSALAHGLTPSLVVLDELHAFQNADLYLTMRTSLLKRPDARMIVISTAGTGADSPLGRLRARALASEQVTRKGALTTAHSSTLAMLEWAVAEGARLDDMRAVKQANPSPRITIEALEAQREAVPRISFGRFHAGSWLEAEGSWLPPGAWQECAGDATIEPGEKVWIGVDVGGERSASAVVMCTEDLRVQAFVFQGDGAVLDCAEKVRALATEFEIVEVAHDPWRFQQAALELERDGLRIVQIPQTLPRLIPMSEALYKAVIEKRITHGNQPDLNRHVAAAIAKPETRGWRLAKAHRSAQIDALIAMGMALERAEAKPEPVQLLGWL